MTILKGGIPLSASEAQKYCKTIQNLNIPKQLSLPSLLPNIQHYVYTGVSKN